MISTNEPPINFYMLSGSYFCDWNGGSDNFMRGVLSTTNYGLASLWTRDGTWRLGSLAMGGTLSDALLDTVNANPSGRSSRTTYILGDPSLRTFFTPPVTNLAANVQGNTITLTWNGNGDPVGQYLVYRSTSTVINSPTNFTKLTPIPISSLNFVDITALINKTYQVRALGKVFTGSGSFTNMSQGVFLYVN